MLTNSEKLPTNCRSLNKISPVTGGLYLIESMKIYCIKKQIPSLRQAAIKAGISPQNFSWKTEKGSFYLSDIEKVAAALDAELEIKFINKKTGEPII